MLRHVSEERNKLSIQFFSRRKLVAGDGVNHCGALRHVCRQEGGEPPRGGVNGNMNLTVLLIAAYLPVLPVLFIILRSGSFGRGSAGTFLKLFFLGVAAAVPSFLMEAGAMIALTVLLRVFLSNAQEQSFHMISSILRYVLVAAVIEEAWKHFVLRKSTWTQMTMDTVADGVAASAAVAAGFSAVMYIAWQASYKVIPADMEVLRSGMPDFLAAGAVVSFVYALLFIFAHFGISGFMGALYGLAKGADQKNHSGRAGFMLSLSYLLPVLVHGACAGMIGYGISTENPVWYVLGFAAEGVLALIMAIVLGSARDAALAASAANAAYTAAKAEMPAAGAESAEFSEDVGDMDLSERDETENELYLDVKDDTPGFPEEAPGTSVMAIDEPSAEQQDQAEEEDTYSRSDTDV